jgi:hypothetical protein
MKQMALYVVLLTLMVLEVLGCANAQIPQPQNFSPFCPPAEWNKTNATSSLEDLIHGQNAQISNFEALLHQYSSLFSGQNNSTLLASFEDLLRRQTVLHNYFSGVLGTGQTWNFTNAADQVTLLNSFGDMLYQEKSLYDSFYTLLSATWCNSAFQDSPNCGSVTNSQMEFLYSFEDLISRQDHLLTDYYNLTTGLNTSVSTADKLALVEKDESLIRWHSKVLSNLTNLINNACTTWT